MGNVNLNTGDNAHDDLLPEYDEYVRDETGYYARVQLLVADGILTDDGLAPALIRIDTVTDEVVCNYDDDTRLVSELVAPGESVLTTQEPSTTGATDGSVLELGMRFNTLVDGTITAIRYWKDVADTDAALASDAPHVGTIWDTEGNVLASVEFSGETSSGWQEQALAVPLAILSGTNYVVSVQSKFFVLTSHGFDSEIVNGNVTGVQGLFAAVGVFPDGVFNNTNYFRDIVFVAD